MDGEFLTHSRMDMDGGGRKYRKDFVHSKQGLILSVSAALVIFVLLVMLFVIFGYQDRKFATMENVMMSHNSSLTSVETELKGKLQDTDQKVMTALGEMKAKLDSSDKLAEFQNRMMTEVAKLSSSVESLFSKLQSTDERVMAALAEMKANQEGSNATTVLSCKSGWMMFGFRCYLFSNDKLSWHQARDYCRSHNSFLLTLESDAEWAFVTSKTTKFHFWVGLTDELTGQWRWDDGTPYVMNKDQWEPGQPDDWRNHGLGEEGEDCAHLKKEGKLNDAHCSYKINYICRTNARMTDHD